MNPFPGSITAILAEVIVNCGPWPKVMGQHSPRTTAARQIQDSVDDPPKINRAGTSAKLGFRQQWRDQLPLAIRQIRRVQVCFPTPFIGLLAVFMYFSYTFLEFYGDLDGR